jgi:hypothetical protein
MNYRSISSHRGSPDPRLVELAARLGFNDVCFQTEGDQGRMLRELRDRADRSGTFEHIRRLGMTVSLWTHEFEDLDPAWGPIALENEAVWEGLRNRYDHLLRTWCPEVDFLVLTVVESTVRCTDPALLERLVLAVREACRANGKRLIMRSFVWTLEEFAGVREAIGRLPDDVKVMTKYVPQDWHRGAIHDPLIGKVGAKEQIVELDIAGEYFRGDHLAHCFVEELHERFAFWKAQGVDGLSVRIDRGWNTWRHHDQVLYQVQESNLWALGMWAAGTATDIETPLSAWAAERFGVAPESETAGELASIARLCDPVVKEALTVCGEPFGDTRRVLPGQRSLLPPGEPPATLDAPAAAPQLVDPFATWLALWRWSPDLTPRCERLRRGDADLAAQKAADTARALALADEALTRLDGICAALDPGAFAFLRFKLEENRHHLVLMGEAAQAWLAALRIRGSDAGERPALLELVDTHLEAMHAEWETHRHEAALVLWQGGAWHLLRCIYLDVPQFCREMRRYVGIAPSRPDPSARHGASVVLVQNRPVLGGNASSEIGIGIVGAGCAGGHWDALSSSFDHEGGLAACSRSGQHQ